MPAPDTLTVLLPAYNAERTFDEALSWLRRQTWKHFQVLMLDDGSTDATPDIARAWESRDSRFVHVRAPRNQGLIATLNDGLRRTQTRWVARMDADDRCDPCRFQWQIDAIAKDDSSVVVSTQGRLFGAKNRTLRFPVTPQAVASRITFDTPVLHAAAVMDAEWLRSKAIWYRNDYPYAEDYDLWSQIHRAGGLMRSIPQVAYGYRIHDASVSRSAYRAQKATAARIRADLFKFHGCPLEAHEFELVRDYAFDGSLLLNDDVLEVFRALNRRIAGRMASLLGRASSPRSLYERGRFFATLLPRPSSGREKLQLAAALARIDPAMAAVFVSAFASGRGS